MNYSELCTQIQNYTENTFSATELATFVQQAEERIYNTVQLPALRKNVTGTTTTSNKYLNCPTDFLSVYSMAVVGNDGAYNYLLNKDVNFIREAYPTPATAALPKYYALFGPRSDIESELTFILGPTPDGAYTIELHYFYYPASIVTASTTWLGDNFESVLLYGSLIEAYTYMKGEQDMMALYQQRYQEALMLLKQLGDGKDRQDSYRSGQYRQAVV